MNAIRTLRLVTLSVAIAVCVEPAFAGEPVADPVRAVWRARAQLATKKLAGSGLDACDRGVELAFEEAEERASGDHRLYMLAIRVDGKQLLVTYNYEGQRLESFGIAALPPGWFTVQKTESRTLTVLLSNGSKCALDLCTTDPGSDGPCAEGSTR